MGATYALGSDRKTLLRASYSRFANRLGTESGFVSAFPGLGIPLLRLERFEPQSSRRTRRDRHFSSFQSATGVDPNDPASTVSVNQIATKTKPPRPTSSSSAWSGRSCRISRRRSPTRTVPRNRASRSLRSSAPAAAATSTLATPREASTGADGFALNFSEPYYGLTDVSGGVSMRRPLGRKPAGLHADLQTAWRSSSSRRSGTAGCSAPASPTTTGSSTSAPAPSSIRTTSREVRTRAARSSSRWATSSAPSSSTRRGSSMSAGWSSFRWASRPPQTSSAARAIRSLYFVQAFTDDTSRRPRLYSRSARSRPIGFPTSTCSTFTSRGLSGSARAVAISPVLDCFNVANSHTVLQRDGIRRVVRRRRIQTEHRG